MSKTYTQQAESNCLSLTLTDLGITRSSNYVKREQIEDFEDLIFNLVTCTPTNQSHVGIKFKKDLGKNKAHDLFLSSLFADLEIDQSKVFLYKNYIEGKNNKNDLKKSVLECNDAMLCLRCDNGVANSLYMAVRNALAHGDILEQNGYIVLYSVSSKSEETDTKKTLNEYESKITFLLQIKSLEKIKSFQTVLMQYNSSLLKEKN